MKINLNWFYFKKQIKIILFYLFIYLLKSTISQLGRAVGDNGVEEQGGLAVEDILNMVVPCKDIEISFEVYMNDDAMDPAVFAWARKKMAKGMQKELRGLRGVSRSRLEGGNGWLRRRLLFLSLRRFLGIWSLKQLCLSRLEFALTFFSVL